MISKGDVVYLKPTANHQFSEGNKYIVYRTIGPIMAKNEKDQIGTQHYFTGIIEITEIHLVPITGVLSNPSSPPIMEATRSIQ